MPSNAHIRNRLVHTLEVASVGRSIGYDVGEILRDDLAAIHLQPNDLGSLVQATCLAHDIGNPPFGHAGEEVIATWMADFVANFDCKEQLDPDLVYFDGNAQGFRILTRADGYRQRGGMKLTYATLGAFIKYPWSAIDERSRKHKKPGQKFGFFETERNAFTEVFNRTGLNGANPRHPAVWLMEAADDIVYTLADLEDAVELKIVTYDKYDELVSKIPEGISGLRYEETDVQRIAYLRAKSIGRLIDICAACFAGNIRTIMSGAYAPQTGLLDLIAQSHPKEFKLVSAIKEFNREIIYVAPRKVEFEIAATDVIGKCLKVFVDACVSFHRHKDNLRDLPHKDNQVVSLMQDYTPITSFSISECIRCAIDFVSGMTDDYASYLSARLRGLDAPR